MTLYLDTSDLVKLYVEEPGSADIRRLIDDADVVVTSALAYPEARATFARRRRARCMTAAEARAAERQLDADFARMVVVPLSVAASRSAGHLAAAHGLRGADAVHLAAFETLLASCGDDDLRFSSADAAQSRAARALGR